MIHEPNQTETNAIGDAADTGGAPRADLPSRVGPGLERPLLPTTPDRLRCVSDALRIGFDNRSETWANHSVADSHGWTIQRAGQADGSRSRRACCIASPIEAGSQSCDRSGSGADRLHASLAQSRSGQQSRPEGGCDARQPVSTPQQPRRSNERRSVQPRRSWATRGIVWLQAFVALLSRYCLSGSDATSQTRRQPRCSRRASADGTQVHSYHRNLFAKGPERTALFVALLWFGQRVVIQSTTWWKPLACHAGRMAFVECHRQARGFRYVSIGPVNRPRTRQAGRPGGSRRRVDWQSTNDPLTGDSADEPP